MTLNTKGFKSISLFAAIALLTANCDYVKDMNYQVTPDPLEMHGDSVKVKVEIQIPEKIKITSFIFLKLKMSIICFCITL